jgi:hypothetical protein
MIKNHFSLLFVVLISSSIFLNGCGKKENTSSGDNKTGETTTEEQKSDQTNNPAGENKNELGIKEGLPADFPSDVPQPENSKVLGSLNTSEGTVVTFESDNKPRDILTQYDAALGKSGYKKADNEMMKDEGGMAMWNKDKKEVSIMLAWDKEKNKTSVVITYK